MRTQLAAAFCVLALLAAPSASAIDAPGWDYAYVEGVATATQRNDRGDITATITCRPPQGDIVLTDYTFGREAQRITRADVRIGVMSVNVPATVERVRGRGRRFAVSVRLPQRPPILAAVQPNDQLSISVNNTSHTLDRGGPTRMQEVAYACWQGT